MIDIDINFIDQLILKDNFILKNLSLFTLYLINKIDVKIEFG